MCHFDNLIKLISLDNDCIFHFIFDVIHGKIRKRIDFVKTLTSFYSFTDLFCTFKFK